MGYQNFFQQNNDMSVAFWTATFTLIGGILIFAIQKLLDQIYFVPINKQKDIVEKIAVGLIKYAKFYTNPISFGNMPSDSTQRRDIELASDTTREFSALLTVSTNNISNYGFWHSLHFIKIKKEDALRAAGKLMQLSNLYSTPGRDIENSILADDIRGLLCIQNPELINFDSSMYFKSKNTSLTILGITAVVLSRIMFIFFDDPEGPNLLVVLGMALIIYFLSLITYLLGPSINGLKKLLLVIFVQIMIVVAFYFCLK